MKFVILILVFIILLISCNKKDSTEQAVPAAVANSKDFSHTEPSYLVEWKDIWKASSLVTELNNFQKKNGLFFETATKVGLLSYLYSEGPCGETYMSLVKDLQVVDESIYEISADGNILQTWNSGSGQVLRIEGDKLYREVKYYENPDDYYLTATPQSKLHAFILSISSQGNLEVFEKNENSAKASEFKEISCPKNEKYGSDYSYCVEESKTKRTYVFQKPCT